MAKQTATVVVVASVPSGKSAAQLRSQYNDLLAECGEFDPETKRILRQREEDQKKWVKDRAGKRAAIVAAKGRVYQALVAAEAAEVKPAEVVA